MGGQNPTLNGCKAGSTCTIAGVFFPDDQVGKEDGVMIQCFGY
jgi:hypothetical protein